MTIDATLLHYRILGKLAEGGMGVVYRARDTRLHRDVAIKVLTDQLAGRPEALTRFRREARILAALNHPNIGAVYGLEEAAGEQFLVMELVEGETLADRLRRGPLSTEEVLDLAEQMVEALAAAHERGIVHRDLKPGNVMIAADGRVRVLDFGLAVSGRRDAGDEPTEGAGEPAAAAPDADAGAPDGRTRPRSRLPRPVAPDAAVTRVGASGRGHLVGTPAYMSPEQIRGACCGERCDLWSVGCLLYEALTGRSPFVRETVADTLSAILEETPPEARVPRAFRELLRRLLDRDPAGRPADAGEVRPLLSAIRRRQANPGRRLATGIAAATTAVVVPALLWLLLAPAALPASRPVPVEEPGRAAPAPGPGDGAEPVAAIADELAVDPGAADAYLRGRYLVSLDHGRARAIEQFRRAIELQPDYAAAWSALANTHVMSNPATEHMPLARQAAVRALELDDSLGEAHAALAQVLFFHDWDWSGAEGEFLRARELDPGSAVAHQRYAAFLWAMGRLDEALAELRRARELDPLSLFVRTEIGRTHYFARDYARAEAVLSEVLELDPDFWWAHLFLGLVHQQTGRYAEATRQLQATRLLMDDDEGAARLGAALDDGGWHAVQRVWLDTWSGRQVQPVSLAFQHAMLGDTDAAFHWLERARAERSRALVYLRVDPQLDPVRDDPRYGELVRRMGFPPS